MASQPARGEIWLAELGRTRGDEQAGSRPVLIVSDDTFNFGPSGLVIVLPLTSTHRGIPAHIPIEHPEGGLKQPSVILCDHIRSISKDRLHDCWGEVSSETMAAVEEQLLILLSL